MEDQSQLLANALLEDKIADIWPEYPCLYDVRSNDFKNRDMREMAYLEIAEKLDKPGKAYVANIQNLLKQYLLQYLIQNLNVTITPSSVA